MEQVVIIRTPKGSPLTQDANPKEYYYTDYFEDLGVSYLAGGLISKGIETFILDTESERLSEIEIAQRALNHNVNIYAISVHAYDFLKVALRIIVEIKKHKKDAIIILGGHPIASVADKLMEMFKDIDFICRGEGEYTFVALVEALLQKTNYEHILGISYRKGNRIIKNMDAERICNLDDIVFPYRYAFEYKDVLSPYYAMVYGSRGCYGNCTMCSVCAFYKNEKGWIARSAENVVDEIEAVYRKYGVKIFSMIDSDFIGNGRAGKERARDIAKLILERKLDIKFDIACRVNGVDRELFALLKKAGLYNVFLGVESGHNKVLKSLRKGTTREENLKAVKILRELGIDVEVGFIMIFPDTTIDEIKENLDFIREMHVFQPYRLGSRLYTDPGFEITEDLERKDVVVGNILEKHYRIDDVQVKMYYELWSELYPFVLPLINKLLLFQLHVLWDDVMLKKSAEMEYEIVDRMINLLLEGIEKIKQDDMDSAFVEKSQNNIKGFIDEKNLYLLELVNSLEKGLPQYEWLGRKVEIIK